MIKLNEQNTYYVIKHPEVDQYARGHSYCVNLHWCNEFDKAEQWISEQSAINHWKRLSNVGNLGKRIEIICIKEKIEREIESKVVDYE